MNENTIFRIAHVHKPYTLLGNAMLQNRDLSIEARGILASILSRPQNWSFRIKWLRQEHGVGRDKVYRLLNELIGNGYCRRSQGQDENGIWQPILYEFTDDPVLFMAQKDAGQPPRPENQEAGENKGFSDESPLPEKPYTANPHTENQDALKRKDSYKSKNSRNTTTGAQGAQSGGGGGSAKPDRGKSIDGDMFRNEALLRSDEGKAFYAYDDMAKELGLRRVRTLSSARRTAIGAAIWLDGVWPDGKGGWREGKLGLDGFLMALDAVRRSPWALGKNSSGWKINLDSLLSGDRIVRLIESAFGNEDEARPSAAYPSAKELASVTLKSWKSRMRIWEEKGRAVWPISWGPSPLMQGCAVPQELLDKHGIEVAA